MPIKIGGRTFDESTLRELGVEALKREALLATEKRRLRLLQEKEKAKTRNLRNKFRVTVQRLIREGKLKKEPCEKCGDKASVARMVEYVPQVSLKVKWLCRKCVFKERDKNGERK